MPTRRGDEHKRGREKEEEREEEDSRGPGGQVCVCVAGMGERGVGQVRGVRVRSSASSSVYLMGSSDVSPRRRELCIAASGCTSALKKIVQCKS